MYFIHSNNISLEERSPSEYEGHHGNVTTDHKGPHG